MGITAVSEATPARSISWFEEGGHHVAVALDPSPGPIDVPVAQLLEDAAINAGWEPWKAEALLAQLTPTVLAAMSSDPVDSLTVTRQVPLTAGVSVEVTVCRMLGEGGPRFHQLWIASF